MHTSVAKLESAAPAEPAGYAELRLRKHPEYQRVYAASRKQFSKEMTFFWAMRDAAHPGAGNGPRFGLTVAKAMMGKAHDRNRMKRRMRAAIVQHAAVLSGVAVDVVLHPRRGVLTLDWEKLEREVAGVFRTVRKQSAGRP